MGQIFLPESIPSITRTSGTVITLPALSNAQATRFNVGGGQFALAAALTMNSAVSGAGGLDTGSIVASSIYYVYAIVHQTTFLPALVASLGANGPTVMPSGYGTAYKLVGKFSSNLTPAIGIIVDLVTPQYYCSIYRNGANIAGLGNGNHTLLFDTAEQDPFGWFVAGNNSITPKVPGKYMCHGSVRHTGDSGSTLLNVVDWISKNGASTNAIYAYPIAGIVAGVSNANGVTSGVYEMNGTTDYLTIQMNVDRTSGTMGYAGLGRYCRLEIVYIGPL